MSWQILVPKKYQIWVYNSSCVSIEFSSKASQRRENYDLLKDNYDLLKDNELRFFYSYLLYRNEIQSSRATVVGRKAKHLLRLPREFSFKVFC